MAVKDFHTYLRILDERDALYENYARQHGLTGKSLQMLLWLATYPQVAGQAVTQKLLVAKTYSTKQVVNATIKNWRAQGYLELLPLLDDKRQKYLQLTAHGQKFAEEIITPLNQYESEAFTKLTEAEQVQLLALTRKYHANLKAQLVKEKG